MRFLLITDEYTQLLGHRFQNSILAFYIGIFQLAVCLWSLTQHIYSIFWFKKVLFCDFTNSTTDAIPVLTKVDAIIFDVGLFHSLWGISRCVAEHLDGGYGRFMWCLCHTFALLFCLPFAFVQRPKPQALWPLLIQQSAYGVGLLILSLAALPKILPTFMGDITKAPVASILFYLFGSSINFFLLYIYWHWYWFVEAEWDIAMKKKYKTNIGIERGQLSTITINNKNNSIHRKIGTEENCVKKYENSNVTFPIYDSSVVVRKNLSLQTNTVPVRKEFKFSSQDGRSFNKATINNYIQSSDFSLNIPLFRKESPSESYTSSIQSNSNRIKTKHNSTISPLTETMYSNLVSDYNDIIVPVSDDESITDDISKSTEEVDIYPQNNIYDSRVARVIDSSIMPKTSLQLYHRNSPTINNSFHNSITDYAFTNKMSPFSSKHTSPRNRTPISDIKYIHNNINRHPQHHDTYQIYDY
uniref:G_PROTEIN_RECEP_F2_4 domain-containing protein n=1 Tax=Parastrongyloides trichosuri TaxID=131310 RepID=A0A0N4ZFT7_PARTI